MMKQNGRNKHSTTLLTNKSTSAIAVDRSVNHVCLIGGLSTTRLLHLLATVKCNYADYCCRKVDCILMNYIGCAFVIFLSALFCLQSSFMFHVGRDIKIFNSMVNVSQSGWPIFNKSIQYFGMNTLRGII